MKEQLSRRDFLKKTSLTAAGASVIPYAAPLSAALNLNSKKSKVVVATDEKCYDWNTKKIDQARIQDMVDYTVKTITGVSDKSKAYEALFPGPVTSSTKILIHYNMMKPKKAYIPVQNAVKTGLTSMLGNTYPAKNIRIVDREGVPNTKEKVKITSSLEYTIKDIWVDSDYFINCPICWAINPSVGGISMNLKGMMTAVGPNSNWGKMHRHTTTAASPWMPILNSHPLFKAKQALCLIAAIEYSLKGANTGSADGALHKIIASKDMIACDYTGLQFLIGKGLPTKNQEPININLDLGSKKPYNLGTNDPNNMEVINIAPPWTTQIIGPGDKIINTVDFTVQTKPTHTIFNQIKGNSAPKSISIFTSTGKKIWYHQSSENSIFWENSDINGNRVAPGMYAYKIRADDIVTQGIVIVH